MTQSTTNPNLRGDVCPKCNASGSIFVEIPGMGKFEIDCDECNGTGIVNSPDACTKCKGSGVVVVNIGFNIEATCDRCNGSGLETPQDD